MHTPCVEQWPAHWGWAGFEAQATNLAAFVRRLPEPRGRLRGSRTRERALGTQNKW